MDVPERWRQLNAYLDQALDMSDGERLQLVSSLREQNPELAAELQALLDEHRAAREERFLEGALIRRELPSGFRVGCYEIVSSLGAGAMGDVYRARDLILNRSVAVKTLPSAFARDSSRLARFKREAQVLASLNHPNIAAIYGFEETDGVHALVLELVDGTTLADRLAQGPMPLAEALAVAKQIAEGLEAAHEQGIIHRDLKPANIKLRDDGAVKVLDFGLAKAVEGRPDASSDPIVSPIITAADLTGMEVVLGTAAYMSPEQAKGRPADRRSDIWAFGCILYEMLTAKRAFGGEDASDTLAHVLLKPPDWTALPAKTSPVIYRLLQRCLEKDRRQRLDSMVAARLDIEEELAGPANAGSNPSGLQDYSRRSIPLWTSAVVLTAAIAGTAGWRLSHADDRMGHTVKFVVPAPENTNFNPSPGFLAVSPDGRSVAFVASSRDGSNYALWIRSLDSLVTRQLAGTDSGVQPFWSADSRFLAFNNTADRRLKKIDVSSGLVQTVSDPSSGQVGAWNREGVILRPYDGVLYRVPADGGAAVSMTTLDRARGETSHVWPQFLPDGRRFLYLARSTQARYDGTLYAASLDSAKATPLLKTDSYTEYAPPGYLLYVRGSTLVAQRFDASALRIDGEPLPVAEQIERNLGNLRAAFSVSQTGVLAYRQISETQLVWCDRTGKALGSVGPPGRYSSPALSPDDRRVAVARGEAASGSRDIWLIEPSRGISSRLTFDGLANEPVWSPDGTRVAYVAGDGFALKASDGTGAAELIRREPSGDLLDWSPDGRALIYQSPFSPKTSFDLWMQPLGGDRKPVSLVQGEFFDVQGQVSPDGRWLAYASDESGRFEVSVQPFPTGQGKWRVSADGGLEPHWGRDGKELFYLALDRRLMAVPVRTGSTFVMGSPTPLFETRMSTLWNYTRNQYAVASDGQRFLINQPAGNASPITVVVDWTAGLKR